MRYITLLATAFALQAGAALLPLEPRTETTSTSAKPACTAGSDVVVNGAFYRYNNDLQTYAPWVVTPGSGNPNCQYQVGSYGLCQYGGPGGYDPNCFKCEYGSGGGSTTISQKINFMPGCEYTVEATVGCSGHNYTDHGAPHIFFQVFLDSTNIIPPQFTCQSCTPQQPCNSDPNYPVYKTVTGKIVGPASGSGNLKIYTNQAAQTVTVAPLLITAISMIAPGTT